MKTRSKTSLFLIELILMLLFFALSAAICMRVFAFAQSTSDYSRNLSIATTRAQSAAECFKAADGDMSRVASLLSGKAMPEGSRFDDGVTVSFDSNWAVSEGASAYTLSLMRTGGEAEIVVRQGSNEVPLFSLAVKAVGHE